MRVMRWDDGMFYAGWQTQPTEDSARVPVQAVGDYPLLMLVTRFIESNKDLQEVWILPHYDEFV